MLFDLASELNRQKLPAQAGVLGLLKRDAQTFLQATPASGEGAGDELSPAAIEAQIAAKKAKNFAEADRIRSELSAAGIVLEDGA